MELVRERRVLFEGVSIGVAPPQVRLDHCLKPCKFAKGLI
jgi:hypothetical protein